MLHKLVVEVEGHREPVGDGTVGKAQVPHLSHVGRLDAEGVPVCEADGIQVGDLDDREVPLRGLGNRWPRCGKVRLDLGAGGGSDGVALRRNAVVDVSADEIIYVVIVEGVADEGVGNAVLHGSKINVSKRRLGHCGDDAGDAGQLVGQDLIHHDVAGVGPFLQRHQAQEAETLAEIEREKRNVGEDVSRQQHVDAGSVVECFFLVIKVDQMVRQRVVG